MIGIPRPAPFSWADKLLSQGKLGATLEQLDARRQELERIDHDEHDVLRAEVCVELGRIAEASDLATHARHRRRLSAERVARASRVLAWAAYFNGDLASITKHLTAARVAAAEASSASVIAHVEVSSFSLGLALEPIETALARLPRVRRAILKVASPHLIAILRLAVGTGRGTTSCARRSSATPACGRPRLEDASEFVARRVHAH